MTNQLALHSRIVPILLLWACACLGQSSKLSKDLDGLGATATSDVIIQYINAPTDADVQKVAGKNGKLKHKFDKMPAAAYEAVSASQLSVLASDPNVKYISPDRKVSGTMLEFAEPAMNANIALSYGYDGTGVGVAIIDSGVLPSHPDLAGGGHSRVVYSQSFVPGEPPPPTSTVTVRMWQGSSAAMVRCRPVGYTHFAALLPM